jgi:7-cyano-7-deazaguanine synthase
MVDSVAIVSGGMDSVTLLHHLVKTEKLNPAVISFAYGQKHAKEIEYARENAVILGLENFRVVDLSPFSGIFSGSALVSEEVAIPDIETVRGNPQPPTYVPNRNMLFLAFAVAYAESLETSRVFYGAQKMDSYGYWDCTPEFLQKLNTVYALNRGKPVQIEAPFVHYSKADILRTGLDIGVDYGKTWSCYAGHEKACGRCSTCAERLKAFAEVGMVDPVQYG